MTERADKLRDLRMDEARAEGSLLSIIGTMLIYHAHGGEKPEHWARLHEAYCAYEMCRRALLDCLCEPIEQVQQ